MIARGRSNIEEEEIYIGEREREREREGLEVVVGSGLGGCQMSSPKTTIFFFFLKKNLFK